MRPRSTAGSRNGRRKELPTFEDMVGKSVSGTEVAFHWASTGSRAAATSVQVRSGCRGVSETLRDYHKGPYLPVPRESSP